MPASQTPHPLAPLAERRFSADHVWIDPGGFIGVTPHLFGRPGPVVRVELPELGTELVVAEPFAVIELEKATLDVFAPCTAVVVALDEALDDLAERPLERWLVRVECELPELLTWSSYRARFGAPR